jgi:hypothetical protein
MSDELPQPSGKFNKAWASIGAFVYGILALVGVDPSAAVETAGATVLVVTPGVVWLVKNGVPLLKQLGDLFRSSS